MTEAVKKKIDAGSKKIADNYCKVVYGVSPEDLLQSVDKANKSKFEADRNAVFNLFNELGLNAEQISKTLKFDLAFVQSTLDNYHKKA
jgi:hypothetical protein